MSAVLLLRVRARGVALPVGYVVEHMRPLPVEPLRGTPPYILGMSRVRGEAIPVMDLGLFLTGTAGPPPERWVTVRSGDRCVALGVDSVSGVKQAELLKFTALPRLLLDADTAAVDALGVLDASLVMLLHAARLLDAAAPSEAG